MSETILNGVHLALIVIAVVLWGRALSRGEVHRWLDSPPRLGWWRIDSTLFLLFLVFVCLLPLGSVWAADQILARLTDDPLEIDSMLIRGFGQYLCWLLACLVFRLPGDQANAQTNVFFLVAFGRGLRAFVLFLPVLGLVTLGWEWVLEASKIPIEEQDTVQMLRNLDDPLRHTLWGLQIVVVAPLVEELVFRAGLFRFLMARLPMKWAVLATSVLFGLIHQSWVAFVPLSVLGALLCLLYAKTGRLVAPIVLHAAVNLNTLFIIWLSDRL